MNWTAVALSVKLAALVAAILLLIGVPIAHWLTFSRWRGKFLVEAVVALPLVLPPTVLGFYVLLAIGSRSPIGRSGGGRPRGGTDRSGGCGSAGPATAWPSRSPPSSSRRFCTACRLPCSRLPRRSRSSI